MDTPNQTDYKNQIEDLNTQVANLQNLVNSLQNQQTNPSTNIPQISGSSKTTTIPAVTGVNVLSQNSGPAGVKMAIGFSTPPGILAGQIDHYNVWMQLGANPTTQAPVVVGTTKNSPAIFTVSSVTSSVTAVFGVQTVMKDGQVLAFNLCPTTSATLAISSAVSANTALTGVNLTANTLTNEGPAITISTAGTYIVIYALEASSSTSTLVHGTLNKNGVQTGTNFNLSTAGTIDSNLGIFTVVCAAGDVLQTVVKSDATATFNLTVQTLVSKDFVT